jgi:hypothetical protein
MTEAEQIIALEQRLNAAWADSQTRNWTCAGYHVWPLICHAINTIALEKVLLNRKTMPDRAIGQAALRGYAVFGERLLTKAQDKSLPRSFWDAGDVVGIATISAAMPDNGYCRTVDPFRQSAHQKGAPSKLLYVDADDRDARISSNPLGDAKGIASELAAIRRRSRRRNNPRYDLPGFENWAVAISELVNYKLGPLSGWVARLLDHFTEYCLTFEQMINAATPRAVLLSDHGDALSAALCATARRAKVPVVCIQHGTLRRTDPEHPLHDYRDFDAMTLPARHWVWRTERLHDRDRAVGPPALLASFDAELGDASITNRAISATARSANQPFTCLAAPQIPEHGSQIADQIKKIARPTRCIWRPHPRFANDRKANDKAIRELLSAGTTEVIRDAQSLANSLLQSDIVITGYSAVALEAAALGIPTHFLSPFAAWTFEGQIPEHLQSINDLRPDHPSLPQSEHEATLSASQRIRRFSETFGALRDSAVQEILEKPVSA